MCDDEGDLLDENEAIFCSLFCIFFLNRVTTQPLQEADLVLGGAVHKNETGTQLWLCDTCRFFFLRRDVLL